MEQEIDRLLEAAAHGVITEKECDEAIDALINEQNRQRNNDN